MDLVFYGVGGVDQHIAEEYKVSVRSTVCSSRCSLMSGPYPAVAVTAAAAVAVAVVAAGRLRRADQLPHHLDQH